MYFSVFKEPRGLVKCLQFVLTIFAFATTCGVFTESKYSIACSKTNVSEHAIRIWYPFSLDTKDNAVKKDLCLNKSSNDMLYPSGNYQSASQFYVFIGVMAWLYSLGGAILYVVFNDNWENSDRIRIADFVITCVFVVMWLIASSAWADGVSNLKHFSDPNNGILNRLPFCKNTPQNCVVRSQGDFATLNVSLIFGFGNMVLFAASLWFLWKETPWHKAREEFNAPQNDLPPEQMPSPEGSMPAH